MSINKEKDIYLKDGKLDLSILDEETIKLQIQDTDKNLETDQEHNSILDDLESIDLSNVDISATLEEMAMIFEEEDAYKKAFNKERLQEEKKEFDKRD